MMTLTYCLGTFYMGISVTYLGTFDFDNIVEIFGI